MSSLLFVVLALLASSSSALAPSSERDKSALVFPLDNDVFQSASSLSEIDYNVGGSYSAVEREDDIIPKQREKRKAVYRSTRNETR